MGGRQRLLAAPADCNTAQPENVRWQASPPDQLRPRPVRLRCTEDKRDRIRWHYQDMITVPLPLWKPALLFWLVPLFFEPPPPPPRSLPLPLYSLMPPEPPL